MTVMTEYAVIKSFTNLPEGCIIKRQMLKNMTIREDNRMMDKDTAIKKMLQPQEFFVAYAQATNMPYISCDEETMEDEVWGFCFRR